jgi:hypothetical protein
MQTFLGTSLPLPDDDTDVEELRGVFEMSEEDEFWGSSTSFGRVIDNVASGAKNSFIHLCQ